MSSILGWRTATHILAMAAMAAACSPALNWREVPLEGLVALLPCKPDHAQRLVQLGPSNASMQVSGCEAAGALYAISHVRVAEPALREQTQDAWRQASLATLQAGTVQTQTRALAKPRAGQAQASPLTGEAAVSFSVEMAQGKRPDGSPLQAQMAWLSTRLDIYQVAVYAPQLDKEMTELLFSELRLP